MLTSIVRNNIPVPLFLLTMYIIAVCPRCHVYAIVMEMDSFEGLPVDTRTNKANILLKKKTFGGIPAGAGVRPDVISLFEEMEEARKNLLQIQKLINITPEPNIVLGKTCACLLLDISANNKCYVSLSMLICLKWLRLMFGF